MNRRDVFRSIGAACLSAPLAFLCRDKPGLVGIGLDQRLPDLVPDGSTAWTPGKTMVYADLDWGNGRIERIQQDAVRR